MKQYRLEFSRGINVVADKATLQPGSVTIADGVDLRSGHIRKFRHHTFIKAGNTTCTCLFVFRGYHYLSDEWRDYITETVNGKDRLYYSRYGLPPQKMIEGAVTDLGLQPPKVAPIASNEKTKGLVLSVAQSTTGGIYQTGTYRSYRVAAKTAKGVQIPCNAKTVTFSNPTPLSTHSATISWTAVQDAVSYVVFGGPSGNETLAIEVGNAVLSVTDDGSWAQGEPVRNYEDNALYSYIYTFERDFKGQIDESGPSPVSVEINTTYGRQLMFSDQTDGFFDQSTVETITGPFTVGLASSAPSTGITSATVNKISNQTILVLTSSTGIKSGDTVRFWKAGVPSESYEVTVGADDQHVLVGYALDWLDSTYLLQPLKTYAEWTPGPETPITDDTVLFVTSTTSGGTQTGSYRGRLETPTVAGNLRVSFPYESQDGTSYAITSIKYVPENGYITSRNLYRTAPAGGWSLVEKIPVWQTEYTDTTAASELGGSPTSYYVEDGVQVVGSKPPTGMSALTSHYGMAFAISGMRVRWTPIGVLDSWPEAFYQEFPSAPVKLASFAGALIVLCEDGVYRLDGTQPTALAVNGTKAHDGCIAPNSVQVTSDMGLLYLSRRGIMAFDGMSAVCITDQSIPDRFWTAPSGLSGDSTHFGLLPTLASHNYAALAYEDGIRSEFTIGYAQHLNNPIPGAIRDIGSFVWNGRYFLYWNDASGDYGAHSVVCLDLKRPGAPISTLPYRFRAACVDESGRAYAVLMDTSPNPTTVTITHEVEP